MSGKKRRLWPIFRPEELIATVLVCVIALAIVAALGYADALVPGQHDGYWTMTH
jgi:hypothetical protein